MTHRYPNSAQPTVMIPQPPACSLAPLQTIFDHGASPPDHCMLEAEFILVGLVPVDIIVNFMKIERIFFSPVLHLGIHTCRKYLFLNLRILKSDFFHYDLKIEIVYN